MFHAFFHHMSTSWAFYPNDCGWPSMGQGSALGGAVRTLGVSWRPGLRGWPGFFPELSERMGVPPVIIHFRLGFSINHQFISIYWVPPWLWKPLSWWKEWRWTIGGLRIKKQKETTWILMTFWVNTWLCMCFTSYGSSSQRCLLMATGNPCLKPADVFAYFVLARAFDFQHVFVKVC